MAVTRNAIVLGSSGSVGAILVRELMRGGGFRRVITLSRRAEPAHAELSKKTGVLLTEKLFPAMNPETLRSATVEVALELGETLEAFSTLGVGANTAKLSLEEHRAVDVALNEAFARGLSEAGLVAHLAFMSAVGANAEAKASGSGAAGMPRYNRVKGEAEEAVRAAFSGLLSIFRPSMILGSKHTPWLLEKTLPLLSFVTPGQFKSIRAEEIAWAMIATAKHHPARSATYHYPEMMDLIARANRESSSTNELG